MPTFDDRITKIAELLDEATLGDWRVVSSERPTIYTDVSQGWKPGSEVWYGGYMGTGELAEFSKYSEAEVDADLVVELHNAAPEIVHWHKQYQMIVAELRQMTPIRLHDNPEAMIKWLRRPLDY